MKLRLSLLHAATAIMLALTAVASADFVTTANPVHPSGMRASVDLPGDQHMRNVGGSDGAGLCVGTSNEVVGHWQSIPELDGFQAWLKRRPGGSYPEQLESDLKKFCATKGIAVPPHVQHTGGDVDFLRAAFGTRRAVGMTYGGHDPFYGQYTTIAHMVTGAHLDQKLGAIIDNNQPGNWRWMSDVQLINRWLGRNDDGSQMRDRIGRPVGGGWAVVWLNSPPPPIDSTNPNYLPERSKVIPPEEQVMGGDPNGDPFPGIHVGPELTGSDNLFPNGFDPEMLKPKMQYWIDGEPVDRPKALAHLKRFADEFTDDSKRAFVSVVSDDPATAKLVKDAVAPYSDKLHVQVFSAKSWVTRDRLKSKVTGQLCAASGGKTVYKSEEITKDSLVAACKATLGIIDPPPAPIMPTPKQPDPPAPAPVGPKQPDPQPAPSKPDPVKIPVWLLALGGYLIWRSTRSKA